MSEARLATDLVGRGARLHHNPISHEEVTICAVVATDDGDIRIHVRDSHGKVKLVSRHNLTVYGSDGRL
jgi:hypothetical protein